MSEVTVPDERCDVIVVGGGVIGLSVAFELLRRGREVRLLERDTPGCGATSAAAGMLAPVSEAEREEPRMIALARDSLGRYPEFIADVERLGGIRCDYRREGTMWVAADRDDREALAHLEQSLSLKGLEVSALSADEVLEREPHLSQRVQAGLLLAGDHQLDPRALARGLARAVEALGGRVACGMRVETIEEPDGAPRVCGTGPSGAAFDYWAEDVVLAAGSWSGEGLCRSADRLGLRPVKGQMIRLRGEPLLRHVIRTPDVYLVPRLSGELLVGATVEELGFDLTSTAGPVLNLLRRAWQLLPGIHDLEFSGTMVGLRPAVVDHLPVIGPSAAGGVHFAVGHYRSGILLAPATAHYLAEWLVSGERPEMLRGFGADRLEATHALRP